MEKEASYRDQTAYACSAQNPDMLPNIQKKGSGAKGLQASATAEFEAHERKKR